jgi:predicted adenine nucleotide alpha hydrolase (AANH) superfamily ATPase
MTNCIDCGQNAVNNSKRCWACWDIYISSATNKKEEEDREAEYTKTVSTKDTQEMPKVDLAGKSK